ncbi:MAG: hypothetical protein KKF57_14985 [Firmicutes bacterium]|nr:hypothetical protein [Bacillota bacterium]
MRCSRGYHLKVLSVVVLLLSLLAACDGENSTGDAFIKYVKLSENEQKLLSLSNEDTQVFDIELKNDSIRKVIVTIDYYENGKFISQISQLTHLISKEQPQDLLRAFILRQTAHNDERKWITILSEENGSDVSTDSFQNIEHIVEGEYGSNQTTVRTGPIKMGEKKIISTLLYSNDDEFAYLREIQTEEDFMKIPNNDLVYLFSIELQ